MATITVPGMFLTGDHASRPAAGDVGTGSLYACSTHDLVYQTDGSTWTTWLDATGAVVAYGSNVNAVGEANAGGASSSVSRADHVHTGVRSIAHSSNTFAGPVIFTTSGLAAITSPTPGTYNIHAAGDGAGGGGGLSDQGAFTFLDATEAAAPATPASGKVRIYAKSDGRIYSMDDGGTESGPFDAAGGGGADLADFRLTGWADDPSDIALGTYGDELEYDSLAALTAVWAKANGASGTLADDDIFRGGSDVSLPTRGIGGRGLVRTGLTLPADFEVGLLVSWAGLDNTMVGIGVHNGTNGIAAVAYSGTTYEIRLNSTYSYDGFNSGSGTPNTHDPVWLFLRRLSGNWRVRFSNDGAQNFTTSDAGTAGTVTGADRIWIGGAFSNAGYPRFHRVVYGAPNLGLG